MADDPSSNAGQLPSSLRAELLRFPRPDGGLDLYDPLLRRLHRYDSAWIPDEVLRRDLLVEGPEIATIRRQIYEAERWREPRAVQWEHASPPDALFAEASTLPRLVAPAWREPEPWRRLCEERIAGRRRLILRGWLEEEAALDLWRELEPGPWARMDTDAVVADRYCNAVIQQYVRGLYGLLLHPGLRKLLGAALGVVLPEDVLLNGWRLGPGDRFKLHPDGHTYVATFALGINPGWSAADGGAIAFGEPAAGGMVVHERWLPFAGDLLCFVPDASSWHVVEPPTRTRLTLSGWWVAP